tara:strand:+ start:76 stop:390 length:315 start_codon:yes stop_codon:yes gene_type:complete
MASSGKREQDGVSTPHFTDIPIICILWPIYDIPHRTICHFCEPTDQSASGNRICKEGGWTLNPPVDFPTLIFKGFHIRQLDIMSLIVFKGIDDPDPIAVCSAQS